MRRIGVLLLLLALLLAGCTRAFYRRWADRETYQVIDQHSDEGRWPIANDRIIPPPESRLYDPFNPDRPPMPPDDPAADRFMMRPNGIRGSRHFHDDGDAPFIEDPGWRSYLTLNANGKLALTPDRAVELGVLNSRDYQTALETVYLNALSLTLNRFEFDCHWFLTNDSMYTWFGAGPTEVDTFNTASTFGFTRNLYAGVQFLAEFANSFVFTFTPGNNVTVGISSLTASLTQPLLRGAGRRVRLEGLTEAERQVLYSVRQFARFRKLFYVNLTTTPGSGFLSLLQQVQTIRNQEADVKSQQENYRMHEALFRAESVSSIQVDQALQSLLQSRLTLIQVQTNLESALDSYKISLGLPPGLPVTLDDSLLRPFQLAAPELEQLQDETDRFFAGFRERDQAPTVQELRDGFAKLSKLHERGGKLLDEVEKELRDWKGQLGVGIDDPAQAAREREAYQRLERQMPEYRRDFIQLTKDIAGDAARVDEQRRKKAWEAIQDRSRQVIKQLAELFVLQTQIRVYLIRLKPVPYRLDEAVEYARANRLDLMNQQGRVVDAWRQVAVTANALKGDLSVTGTAIVATPPLLDHPLDFDASATSYSVGVQFSGPLNRLAERNVYRASQISYQQARRTYMALEDQVEAQIRQDMRSLEQARISFGIARLALITAARQVDATRERLLIGDNSGTTTTLDILNALSALLQAKSTLIGSWVNYESSRAQLLLDMEALQLTPQGVPADEPDHEPVPDLLPASTPLFPGQPSGGSARQEAAG